MASRFANPFPRFFNSNAAVLASGRLNFYTSVSGSTTRKDTYSDAGLTTANTNPVILTAGGVIPDIFLDGTYRVTLEERTSDGEYVQIDEAISVGDLGVTIFETWMSDTDYAVGAIVTGSNGLYYKSLQTPNQGNDPASGSPTYWEEIRFIRVYNANVTYSAGDIVQDSNGNLWKSLVGSNTGNTPSTSPTQWTGAFLPSILRSSRTSNTILDGDDNGYLIDFTSNTFTQTFTAAATLGDGWYVYLENSGTGDITLDPDGSETIDGLTTFIMYPGEVRLVLCDGSNFQSILLNSFTRTFYSSGTLTKPPGYKSFKLELWGAGGGGGGNNTTEGGGGGGGGGYHDLLVDESYLSAVGS